MRYSGIITKKIFQHLNGDKEKKCIFAGFLKWNAKAGGKEGFEPRNSLISRTVMDIGKD